LVDAEKLNNGQKAKLVSEVVKQESQFKDKDGNAKTENIGSFALQGDDRCTTCVLTGDDLRSD